MDEDGGALDVGVLDAAARADLLRVLESDSRVRADLIRQFYERQGGKGMAEILMDLEADEFLRLQVVLLLPGTRPRNRVEQVLLSRTCAHLHPAVPEPRSVVFVAW